MTKKHKLLLVAHFGEDYVDYRANFLDYLAARGVSVHALVPKDNYYKEAVEKGHPISFFKYRRSMAAIFYFLPFYYKLKHIIKEEQITHVYTLKFFPNLMGVLAARAMPGVKVTATIAGLGFLDGRNSKPLVAFVFKVYMHVLNKADSVIIQNKDDLKSLQKHLSKPKLLLTYGSGVDGDLFKNPKPASPKEIGLPSNKDYVVLCSRIVRQKGVMELVRGYLQAQEKSTLNFDLVIAGWYDDKGLEKELQKLASQQPQIHLLGYQKDVRPLLSAAQAVILPSYYPEGVPRSLTEALGMQKPIITTNHKGCRETCIDGVNGFLVEPKSVSSLEEVLLKFNSLSLAQKCEMEKQSAALFAQKFEQNKVFSGIIEALDL